MNEEHDTLDIVTNYIEDADRYGLVSEVVYYSLKYMKKNPESSIEEAIGHGYYEWIK